MAKTFSFEEGLPTATKVAPTTFSFEDALRPSKAEEPGIVDKISSALGIGEPKSVLAGTTLPSDAPPMGNRMIEEVGTGPASTAGLPKFDVSKMPTKEEQIAKDLAAPTEDMGMLESGLQYGKRALVGAGKGMVQGYGGNVRFVQDLFGFDTSKTEGTLNQLAKEQAAVPEAQSYWPRIAEGAVTSIAQQTPLLLGSIATGSEIPVLAGMFQQSFGQTYDESRRKNLSVGDATGRATLYGTFEVIGEKFGLGDLMKGIKSAANGVPTKELLGYFAKSLAKEIPGEQLTYFGQFATDKGYGMNPEAGIKEFLQGSLDTAAATVVQGGMMMGGGATINKLRQGYNKIVPGLGNKVVKEAEESLLAKPEQPAAAPQEPSVTVEQAPKEFEAAKPIEQAPVPPSESQDTAAMMAEVEGKPLAAVTPVTTEAEPVTPEVTPVTEPKAEGHVIPALQTQELPVSALTLSKDVPQFKSDANAKGVVEPLTGKFDRTGVAPIQVWERNNGDLEVISGRHRLDLAKRTGEKTIPAQVHKESEGFDAVKAASLDALLNIREGQGKVKDYVTYFQRPGYTREEAESSGVLARATGQRAYSIATNGSSDLIAAHRADKLSDDAAAKIANIAPKEDALQALGIKMIQDGKTIANTVNTMQAVKAMSSERGEATVDMFGFDDSAMREAQEMAKIAARKQAEISNDLAAVTGAAKRPETAKKYGIDVKDPASILAKAEQLRQQKAAWDNWSSSSELIGQIRQEMKPVLEQPTPESLKAKEEAAQEAKVAEEKAAAEVQKASKAEQEKKEIAKQSEAVADTFELGQTPEESLSGQQDIFAEPETKEPKAESVTQTDTPQFKKWFGNSKITNEDGSPKVLYHITPKDFETFIPGGIPEEGRNLDSGKAIWMSPNKERQPAAHNISSSKYDYREGVNVMPLYVKMERPLLIDDRTTADWAVATFADGDNSFPLLMPDKWINAVKEAGYDGIIYLNPYSSLEKIPGKDEEYIVFDPKQVKSAIGNTGEFNPESESIISALGTAEQNETVDKVAKEVRGKVVWQDGDKALIRTYGAKTGNPIYIFSNGLSHTNYDISQDARLTAKQLGITEQQKEEVIKLRADLESQAEKEHKDNPFLVIGKGITASKGVPKKIASVAKDWADILNLGVDIHIMTSEEASANRDQFTGPHRSIGYMGLMDEPGVVKQVSPGQYVMVLKKSTSIGKSLEILAHEMGHIHEAQVFNKADVATKNAVIQDFNDWFRRVEKGTAKELVHALRAKNAAQQTEVDPTALAKNMKKLDYWMSFSEWYADQVSRWSVTNEKPMTVVEKFFSRLAAAMKKFYQTVKGMKYLPSETFNQYMDKVSSQVAILPDELVDFVPEGDQLPLFSESKVLAKEHYLNPRRNYAGDEPPLSQWTSPDESKLDDFAYKIQDKLIDTKRVIQQITKSAGEIAQRFNAYVKEELYHGRTAKRTEDFLKRELLPMVQEMNSKGVSVEEFDTYLHNRHAKERNEQVARVNPNMQDGGSGITTENAKKYLDNLDPKKKAAYEALAKKLDAIVANTQKLLVSSGLESQETIDAWNDTYEHYVPLMRDDLDFVHHGKGFGQGFQVKGGTSKRATGSKKDVVDIFANIALQRERAIMRSEKARVGRALYGLAIQNPNPDFWLPVNPDAVKNKEKLKEELINLGLSPEDAENLIQEPKTAKVDKRTGKVIYEINPALRNSDNVFAVRIDGKDRYIFFNSSDPRAMRMVESIKNLDAEQLGLALGTIGQVTRWVASVNTQYNPVFGAWNFTRDSLGAAFNLSTTAIAGKQAQVMKDIFPALWGIYRDLRKGRKGAEHDSDWARLWEEFQNAGGQTGYKQQFTQQRTQFEGFKPVSKKIHIIEDAFADLNKGNARKAAAAVFNWLSDYNDAMENAVRLSAYKVALDQFKKQGMTQEDAVDKAASLAKNLTVNFNRKGQVSGTMGALFAFFNASVQGTARLAETLSGPAGRKIVAGGITLGVVQALALAMAGFGDDDPPQFVKDKNLIIPLPDGKYAVIPMPLGLNMLPGVGRISTEYVLGKMGLISGGKDLAKKGIELAGLVLDSFNPLGGGSLAQMITPTIADPVVAIATNKDAFGRPISKEDRATAPTPGYTRSRENASEISQYIAKFLNYASGGTKYKKGELSPTADQIDYLVGQYTGGVGREVQKAGEVIKSQFTGEEVPTYRKPIIGKVYGDINSPAAVSSRFYQNVTEMAQHENEIKGRQKNKENVQEYFKEHPEARMIDQANRIENQITQINKDRKILMERKAPKEKIKKLEDTKINIMRQFNQRVEKQMEKKREE